MYGRSGAGAAEFGKKVFVMAHGAPTRRGWEIGPLIITVIDWLYLAGKDPHHPPGLPPRRQTAPVAIVSSLPMS